MNRTQISLIGLKSKRIIVQSLKKYNVTHRRCSVDFFTKWINDWKPNGRPVCEVDEHTISRIDNQC